MFALNSLQPIVRAALNTRRIDAAPQAGEKAMGLETTARKWVEMQGFLVDVELFFELNRGNGFEGGN